MSKKVAVSKIIIEIGGEPKELTLEQAKELQGALNDLFGKTSTVFIPGAPIYIERPHNPYVYPRWGEVHWSANNGGALTYSASNSSN